jgi:hypothetical protein
MVGKVLWATNLYHTSGEAALPQNAFIPTVAVDPPPAVLNVPAIELQSPLFEVKRVELPHASLPGWAMEKSGNNKNIPIRKLIPILYLVRERV